MAAVSLKLESRIGTDPAWPLGPGALGAKKQGLERLLSLTSVIGMSGYFFVCSIVIGALQQIILREPRTQALTTSFRAPRCTCREPLVGLIPPDAHAFLKRSRITSRNDYRQPI